VLVIKKHAPLTHSIPKLNTFEIHNQCLDWDPLGVLVEYVGVELDCFKIFWIPFLPICNPFFWIWIQFNSIGNQFKLHCNVVHISISYKNELVSPISRKFNFFSYSTRINLSFPCFYNTFNLGANYTLHHIIITLWLKFIYIKVISTCHVIDIMNICCLIKLHVNMLTLLKRLSTKEQNSNVNVIGANGM
jgi:hypothetical protein